VSLKFFEGARACVHTISYPAAAAAGTAAGAAAAAAANNSGDFSAPISLLLAYRLFCCIW
jgi:hypothetical protein